MSISRLFVIGASSGGHSAISKIFENIDSSIDASFIIVIHSAFDMPSFFKTVLKAKTNLPILEVTDGVKIKPRTIYLAQPNNHLIVDKDTLILSKGPRENLFRPAIDVLFRSAAVSYKNRCVGVLLTGRLNDGTSGLEAITKCGGTTIIENPETAEYSDMPSFAQDTLALDYVEDLDNIAQIMKHITTQPLPPEKDIPNYLIKENSIANHIGSRIKLEEKLGSQVPISCPSCSGPLWKLENTKVKRYRCHVGHSFTEKALLKGQNEALEEALWVSMRTLEEKKMLLQRMLKQYTERGSNSLVRSYKDKLKETSKHVESIRNILELDD